MPEWCDLNPETPVLSRRERPMSRVHGRDAPGWLILLSLVMHGMVVMSLLSLSPTPRLSDEAEPLSVEVVAEPAGTASQPSIPAETSPAPIASAASAQQADTPSPTVPPAPAPPLAQVPNAPASPPVPSSTPLPPDVPFPPPVPLVAPPSPVQQAELPLPAEQPLPTPPLPPPPLAQVAQVHSPPPRPPAPRPPPPRPANSSGAGVLSAATPAALANAAQAQAAASQAAASHASAVANGSAWLGRLKQWWDGHSFYPREASLADQGGAVRVRIAIAADGQVTLVQLVGSSGSGVLDAAALAVFRGARLLPPPDGAAGPAEVVVTLHYRPAGGG